MLLGFLILVGLYAILHLYNRDMFAKKHLPGEVQVIAHRGASGLAPENTLVAVQKALELKADIIEVDVHLSKDGKLVVIHDTSLDRTTSGTGEVQDVEWEELLELDAGSWFGAEFAGEKIPSLEQVMKLVNGQSIVLIEIKKGKNGLYNGIEEKTVELIRKYQAEEWTIVQSFQKKTVNLFCQIAPELEAHKLLVGSLHPILSHHDGKWHWNSPFTQKDIKAITPNYRFLTRRWINRAHRKGLKVFTYTLNEPKGMQRAIDLGVDGVITNYPDRLNKLLGR